MARRVTVQLLCDPCLADGKEVEAEELPPLNLVGNKPRVLALCEGHRAEVFDPLVEMVKAHGQILDIDAGAAPAKASAKKSSRPAASGASVGDPLVCPECGRDDFAAPQGLGAHRFRAHGVASQAKAG